MADLLLFFRRFEAHHLEAPVISRRNCTIEASEITFFFSPHNLRAGLLGATLTIIWLLQPWISPGLRVEDLTNSGVRDYLFFFALYYRIEIRPVE